jgi:hypothetical protein
MLMGNTEYKWIAQSNYLEITSSTQTKIYIGAAQRPSALPTPGMRRMRPKGNLNPLSSEVIRKI